MRIHDIDLSQILKFVCKLNLSVGMEV